MKNKVDLPIAFALMLFAAFILPILDAGAQDAKSVVGTYAAVSNPSYGDTPRGQLILGQDGHYSLVVLRRTLPKVAGGTREKGTTEENKAIVIGSIAHYGRYTVDTKEKTITFNVEGSTFPNWDGETFKRDLKLSGDQLIYTNKAPSGGGGAIEVVWKRVK